MLATFYQGRHFSSDGQCRILICAVPINLRYPTITIWVEPETDPDLDLICILKSRPPVSNAGQIIGDWLDRLGGTPWHSRLCEALLACQQSLEATTNLWTRLPLSIRNHFQFAVVDSRIRSGHSNAGNEFRSLAFVRRMLSSSSPDAGDQNEPATDSAKERLLRSKSGWQPLIRFGRGLVR